MTAIQGTVGYLKWMRYVARALATLWAGWWTVFSLLSGLGEGYGLGGFFVHPGWIFLLAALIAWRWEIVGGALLILEGLGILAYYPFSWRSEGFLTLALPPLVAGAIFVVVGIMARRPGK